MKAKSFQQYLEKRLNQDEIAEIETLAVLEMEFLQSLQTEISNEVDKYMTEEKIGFNELVRRLGISPTQLSKIQSREANLTLSTIAHIFALLKRKPHFIANEGIKSQNGGSFPNMCAN